MNELNNLLSDNNLPSDGFRPRQVGHKIAQLRDLLRLAFRHEYIMSKSIRFELQDKIWFSLQDQLSDQLNYELHRNHLL